MDDGYLDERIKACGKDVLEQDHPDLLKGFKATVTAKICRFFKNRDELSWPFTNRCWTLSVTVSRSVGAS